MIDHKKGEILNMKNTEQLKQLKALSEFFKLHPIEYIRQLIDREYRRIIEQEK